MNTRLGPSSLLTGLAFVLAVAGCGKEQKPQPRQVARDFFISPATNGTRNEITIILTNAQPPVMRTVVTVSSSREYQLVTVGDDGQQRPAIVGVVPTEEYAGVASEVRVQDADVGSTDGAVYIAAQDAKHPEHIRRLLKFLTK